MGRRMGDLFKVLAGSRGFCYFGTVKHGRIGAKNGGCGYIDAACRVK